LSWRGKETINPHGQSPSLIQAPSGFRDSAQPIFNPGEVVSSAFQIRQPVARVENGQVFEAWDMMLERTVALKAGWRDASSTPLLPEVRLAGAVADDCAVTIYGVGNYKTIEYAVGERVVGQTLADRVAATSGAGLALFDALDILCALASSLVAVHRARLWLRDLTPDTILVTPSGRLVIGRFSLSQVRVGPADGVCYAPEVITGSHDPGDLVAGAAVDLYHLGCIAVQLIAGRAPYLGESMKATLFNHVHQRPPVLASMRADVQVELSDLVTELLAKQPAQRPSQAAEIVAQLETIRERASATRRTVRVLIVDDDSERVRPLWSVVRRAHARVVVDAAHESADAVTKLRRDRPDLVIVNISPGTGTMSGLEVCMYLHGLDESRASTVVAMADHMLPGDAGLLSQLGVPFALSRDAAGIAQVVELVKRMASTPAPPPGRAQRTTING
jgi:serine/threonine protein kinase